MSKDETEGAAPVFSSYGPFKCFIGGFAAIEPMDILCLKSAGGQSYMRMEQCTDNKFCVRIGDFRRNESELRGTCHVFRSFDPQSAP